MSQEILEKTNEISESITDYMKTAADYVGRGAKSLYDNLPISDTQRNILFGDIEGLKKYGGGKTIAFGALRDLGTQAIQRGAGSGALGGAAGGAALGGSIASGGIPAIIAGIGRGAAKGRGGIGKIAGGLAGGIKSLLGAGTRGAIGAGLGGAAGGVAGFKGGRQTGAKIASAAALGAPAGLVAGAVPAGVLGLGGAAVGSDVMKALEKSLAKMSAGGGQDIFRS